MLEPLELAFEVDAAEEAPVDREVVEACAVDDETEFDVEGFCFLAGMGILAPNSFLLKKAKARR